MIPKPHRHYGFSTNQSSFKTSYSKVNEGRFTPAYHAVGGSGAIYEEELILYDGGSVEGWEGINEAL